MSRKTPRQDYIPPKADLVTFLVEIVLANSTYEVDGATMEDYEVVNLFE
jgi:hypothetical protein